MEFRKAPSPRRDILLYFLYEAAAKLKKLNLTSESTTLSRRRKFVFILNLGVFSNQILTSRIFYRHILQQCDNWYTDAIWYIMKFYLGACGALV